MHDVPNHPGAEVPLFLTGSTQRAEGNGKCVCCLEHMSILSYTLDIDDGSIKDYQGMLEDNSILQGGAPKKAKLVQLTPITMVYR